VADSPIPGVVVTIRLEREPDPARQLLWSRLWQRLLAPPPAAEVEPGVDGARAPEASEGSSS
jgi:hypothetical protein